MFPGPIGQSLAGQALEKNIWSLDVINIRDYGLTKHKNIDDEPYGGGNGMVMRPDVLSNAIEDVLTQSEHKPAMFYPSPRGEVFTQSMASKLSNLPHILFLCGRFEGVDQRLLDYYRFEELSLGDFILSGGEIAATAMIDACLRLQTGVIQGPAVHEEESFGVGDAGLLEYPHYTRPATWQETEVPAVLRSGNHAKIAGWRKQQAEIVTKARRPDLWNKYNGQKG